MSIRIMTAVWSTPLPDSEKIVLLALADCANDEGECWPSMATLATKCSKSDRTVQAAIKALAVAGHLTRRESPGKGCRYIVHPTPEAASPPKPLRPAEASPPKPLPVTPEAASDKPSRTITPKKATPPSEKRASKHRAFVPPSDIPEAEWDAFDEMRKRIGKPMTDHARDLAVGRLRKLAEDGWPPGDVLNHSTLNNYQGLFPPKDDDNGHRPTHSMGRNGGRSASGNSRTINAGLGFIADGDPH